MCRSFSIKLIVAMCFLALSASVVSAGPVWIGLDGSPQAAEPNTEIIRSNDDEMVLKISIPGFQEEEIAAGDGIFKALYLPGYLTTMDIGKAQMPVISELLAIPGDVDVTVSIVESSEKVLEGYRIYPFQKPTYDGYDTKPFDIDREFYEQDAFYPASYTALEKPGIWRDLRIVNLKVHTMRYNPARGELAVLTDVTIKLEYRGGSVVNTKEPPSRPISATYDRMYRRSVLNYDSLNLPVEQEDSDLTTQIEYYEYLIIARDDFIDEVTPLANAKNAVGFLTRIKPLSEIGSTVAAIKNYIATQYEENCIKYVLLVGDENYIPAYMGYETSDGEHFFSDFYYTLIDGEDDYPDIALGRFSAPTGGHVTNLTDKSIYYQYGPPPGDWLENALLVAHKEDAPAVRSFQWTKERIKNADQTPFGTYRVLYPDFTTAYGASAAAGGDEATNADVIAAIDAGQRVVNYYGHGNVDRWSGWNIYNESFGSAEVDSLNNGKMTPVIFSIACRTNGLLEDYTCLGEKFTRVVDGAAAMLGATAPSNHLINVLFDQEVFEVIFDQGITTIGDASNAAFVEMIKYYSYGATNAQMYLWFGDPSLDIIYVEGEDPLPAAPTLVSPKNGKTYIVPPFPKYIYFDWNDVTYTDYYQLLVADNSDFLSPLVNKEHVGGSGSKVSFVPFEEEGTYYWCVRAANETGHGPFSAIRNFVVTVGFPIGGDNEDEDRIARKDPVVSEGESAGTGALRASGENNPGRMPERTELYANYPNPFNPATRIAFGISEVSHVSLRIYDSSGRLVRILVNKELSPGRYEEAWDGMDDARRPVASGVYFYRLDAGLLSETQKMILLR